MIIYSILNYNICRGRRPRRPAKQKTVEMLINEKMSNFADEFLLTIYLLNNILKSWEQLYKTYNAPFFYQIFISKKFISGASANFQGGQKMKKNLLKLTNDYIFKRTFGYSGTEEVTQVFLRDIMEKEITKIYLNSNPITEKELMDEKVGIMDIKAVLNGNIHCNIEMQVVNQNDIERRILFYWGKMYTQSIKKGEDYNNLQKAVCVLIADFELDSLKSIEKYITRWNIREEEYKSVILTEVLDIYIIELPKFLKYGKNKQRKNLNLWVEFIKNSEVKFMNEENEDKSIEETKRAIEKAQENLEKLSQDEHERYLAELREKHVRDQKSIERYGYERGKKDERLEIAKKLLGKGYSVKQISEITELTEEEIKDLTKKT